MQIANCKLPAALSSPLAALPDQCVVPGKDTCCNRNSVFKVQHSAFVFHPSSFILHPSAHSLRRAYTLVEILVAMVITMLLLGAVVQMFARVGESITDSRSLLEASERLRSTAARLQMDLQGRTVTMLPPRSPEDGEGYFEYIEGPVMQEYISTAYDWTTNPLNIAPEPVNSESTQNPKPLDSSVGDFDDILLFTTRSTGRPFVGNGPAYILNPNTGRYEFQTIIAQSDVTEVAWFIRGRTLYRRQLLVAPGVWDNLIDPTTNNHVFPPSQGFYGTYIDTTGNRFEHNYDISIRSIKDASNNWIAIPNTLADLTRRECRFEHPAISFPFDARYWGQLGLPTLRECSDPQWYAGVWDSSVMPMVLPNVLPTVDFWSSDPSARFSDSAIIKDNTQTPPLTYQGNRIADDVILTNVIGFDVKVWDPGANNGLGAYVDLGNADSVHNPSPPAFFTDYGVPKSMLRGTANTARVYDTWSTHYENIGLPGLRLNQYPVGGFPGRGANGFDDDGNGVVDDANEQITSPPYPLPLRGVQVKIRIFEPDSRQIRELTVVQDFLPK